MKTQTLSRRNFLKWGALTLGASILSPFVSRLTLSRAAGIPSFFVGINYPWIAYGHDFGNNAWGHDGIITNGWTYQTYSDSQGFTATTRTSEKAKSGSYCLAITVDLDGRSSNKSNGEVFVNLTDHNPHGVTPPLNLTNITLHTWLYLPADSAGDPDARNGIQIFFKSKNPNDDKWYSYYSQWDNIEPTWEGKWHEFTANPSKPPDYKDPQFNPENIVAIGIKMAINSKSKARINGVLYMDNVQLDTNPPIRFDFEQLEVEADMVELACSIDILRVFVFADGGASPEFTPTGAIANPGFDEYFYKDFDALLQTAQKYNIKVIPTLLDFGWCNQAKFTNGVQSGGHSDLIRDANKRQTFLDLALKPFIQRYAASQEIICIDIINEPEWVIKEVAQSQDSDPVTLQEMQDFVQMCTNVIHASSQHLVSVGSARRKWIHYWQDLGLDMYQFHWYEDHIKDEAFPWLPCSDLGLDKPCFVGEVPTASTSRPLKEYIDAALNGGYCGILGWSYRAQDIESDFQSKKPDFPNRCIYLPVVNR